jgi:hypothetical protein
MDAKLVNVQSRLCPPSPLAVPQLPVVLPAAVRPHRPAIAYSQPCGYGVHQKKDPQSPQPCLWPPSWNQFRGEVKVDAEADANGYPPEDLRDRMVG